MTDEQLDIKAAWHCPQCRRDGEREVRALLARRALEARKEALEEAARVANTTPFRAHRDDDVNFHSGCVQTRERIVDAIRSLAAGGERT